MHVVREDPEQEGLLYAGTLAGRVRVVRSGQALADAAAEPAGDAGHRHQSPPRRSRRVDDGPVVLDHGQRLAAAAAGGERHETDAAADDRQSEWAGRSGSQVGRWVRRAARADGGRRARVDADGARRSSAACRQGPLTKSRGPCGGARRDQAVRRIERVPLHARRRPIACATRPSRGRPDVPEYPPAGARIDYYLASAVRRGQARDSRRDRQRSSAATRATATAQRRRTRRRPSRRRVAVGAADESRHEPLRLGSSLRRRTAVERRRHGRRRIWRRRTAGPAGHLQSAAHGGRRRRRPNRSS